MQFAFWVINGEYALHGGHIGRRKRVKSRDGNVPFRFDRNTDTTDCKFLQGTEPRFVAKLTQRSAGKVAPVPYGPSSVTSLWPGSDARQQHAVLSRATQPR